MTALTALVLVLVLVLAQAVAGPVPVPFPSEVPRPLLLDRIAAVVGDDVVPESDVERYVKVGMLPRLEDEDQAAYRARCLDQVVVDLLRQRALRRTAGFEPDARDVEARLREVEARIERERGMPFEAVLERAGVSRAEAREWVREDLEVQTFVRERLLPAVKVTDAEVEAYYEGAFRAEAASAGLAQLPPLREVNDELKVVLRSRKLNAEIDRWTDDLRSRTRVLVYRRGQT